MSIRLGRSRTCFRREKLVRARGATIVLLKMRQPPLTACRVGGARKLGAEPRRIADAHAPPQPPLWRRRRKRPLESIAEGGVNARRKARGEASASPQGRNACLAPTRPRGKVETSPLPDVGRTTSARRLRRPLPARP